MNIERSAFFMGVMKKRETMGWLGGRFTDINVSTFLINVSPTRRSFLANNLVRNYYAHEKRASLNVHGNDSLDDVAFIRM
jgi:hypothetical protein